MHPFHDPVAGIGAGGTVDAFQLRTITDSIPVGHTATHWKQSMQSAIAGFRLLGSGVAGALAHPACDHRPPTIDFDPAKLPVVVRKGTQYDADLFAE